MALRDWLEKKIFPFEAKLTGDDVYRGTMLCMAESLKFGIVSTSDMYYFTPDMVRAVAESGTKNNISRSIVNFDGSEFAKLEAVKELVDAYDRYDGMESGRIKIEASLHAEYTSDENTVKSLAELAKEKNMGMQVHVSETETEHEECKMRHGGRTPVRYLADCGLFDVRTVAAHCVHIEEDDFEILSEKGVTVAANPVSNMKLASGIADTAKMLEKNINLAIGTDSVASSADVLDGVHGRRIHDRLAVRCGHAQVERGHHGPGFGVGVDARHVHARLEAQVVDREAGDSLHTDSYRRVNATRTRAARGGRFNIVSV